jgi:peptide methionine sulfoxide reductase MsrA
VIFYFTPEQQKTAELVKKRLDASGKYNEPIATEITKVGEFWKAEDYHQNYFEKHPERNNCHVPLDNDD